MEEEAAYSGYAWRKYIQGRFDGDLFRACLLEEWCLGYLWERSFVGTSKGDIFRRYLKGYVQGMS